MLRSISSLLRSLLVREFSPKLIYLLVFLVLAVPILCELKLKPSPMNTANKVFEKLNSLEGKRGELVVISLDWGPGTSAENKPQSKLIMEHLLRRRIPFALFTLYQQASPFLKELPLEVVAELKREMPEQDWEYGRDWVNLGYLFNGAIALQALARAEDIRSVQNTDANGLPLDELEIMQGFKNIRNVPLLVEITSLVGVFNTWLQFFRRDDYIPPFIHACTSITIPEAYMYYSSGQILGFFEGVAGAAWYDELLNKVYPRRKEQASGTNTGLAVAQLLVLFLIVWGNVNYFFSRKPK